MARAPLSQAHRSIFDADHRRPFGRRSPPLGGAPPGHDGRFWLLPCTIVKLNRVQRHYEFMITSPTSPPMEGSSEKTSLRAAAARHVFTLRCRVRN